ncbi:MAG: helix-turn-helix domain-containing protein [Saprospiraceae bacterium]|nr:helix-turn-helix domain-containing protein [Bacteroidia bacterium]NNE15484.1 helix-turn-helix domain-containing protein [Saprospiraceae bacterium]NNL92055.1 helix-turn-helix domain-containing protein [Saprospiraceae bacterium]
MKSKLKYKIIKSRRQYNSYCKILEELVFKDRRADEDEIELLTLLIEKYDDEQYQIPELDPIEILKALMSEHKLKAKDLTQILKLTKGTISKILNYQKGLSKETIRKLSDHFKLSQAAFNRPYKLKDPINRKYKNAALMNTQKRIIQTA